MTGQVHHVFPYHPAHLDVEPADWPALQASRWPLAAVARSRHAPHTTVHVIGDRDTEVVVGGLRHRIHRARLSGPRFREFGDDWSMALGRELRGLRAEDVAVVHLYGAVAARRAQRFASGARTVVVVHGGGLGSWDAHPAAADRIVVLRGDQERALNAAGAKPGQVVRTAPSVDRELYRPGGPAQPPLLGYVGRIDQGKGAFEVPAALAAAVRAVPGTAAELVGPFTREARASLEKLAIRHGVADRMQVLGPLPSEHLAECMRRWTLLLLPSFSEGFPIVAIEAAACRLPVAVVARVLSPELEAEPVFSTAPRAQFPALVAAATSSPARPEIPAWVGDHEQGGLFWDELIDGLPAWSPRPVPAGWDPGVLRRFRPARRLRAPLMGALRRLAQATRRG